MYSFIRVCLVINLFDSTKFMSFAKLANSANNGFDTGYVNSSVGVIDTRPNFTRTLVITSCKLSREHSTDRCVVSFLNLTAVDYFLIGMVSYDRLFKCWLCLSFSLLAAWLRIGVNLGTERFLVFGVSNWSAIFNC